jgi:2-iminobutanoate/2-iminopropanoate deaminase
MAKKTIISDKAPKAVGPYSHANEANGFLFLSGMLGLDPATGKLEESLEAQTERSLSNIRTVLDGSGLDFCDVVKTTVFLADMKDFPAVNAIYARYFQADFPARSCVAVAGLPLGARVEIEAVAALER